MWYTAPLFPSFINREGNTKGDGCFAKIQAVSLTKVPQIFRGNVAFACLDVGDVIICHCRYPRKGPLNDLRPRAMLETSSVCCPLKSTLQSFDFHNGCRESETCGGSLSDYLFQSLIKVIEHKACCTNICCANRHLWSKMSVSTDTKIHFRRVVKSAVSTTCDLVSPTLKIVCPPSHFVMNKLLRTPNVLNAPFLNRCLDWQGYRDHNPMPNRSADHKVNTRKTSTSKRCLRLHTKLSQKGLRFFAQLTHNRPPFGNCCLGEFDLEHDENSGCTAVEPAVWH
jgi:hypothetical protein